MELKQDAERAAKLLLRIREGVQRYKLMNGEASRKFAVLAGLADYERRTGRPVTMTQIATTLGMALPNVGRMLRPFEEEGTIVRKRQGRTVCVQITPAGQKLLDRQHDVFLQDAAEALSVLGEEERSLFLACGEKVIAKLDEQLRKRREEVC